MGGQQSKEESLICYGASISDILESAKLQIQGCDTLKTKITKVDGQTLKAFKGMVDLVYFGSYGRPSSNNFTIIGYNRGHWNGTGLENRWLQLGLNDFLRLHTTLDHQTRIAGPPEMGCLQIQIGTGSQRFTAACVNLVYTGPRTLTKHVVQACFLLSQDQEAVVTLVVEKGGKMVAKATGKHKDTSFLWDNGRFVPARYALSAAALQDPTTWRMSVVEDETLDLFSSGGSGYRTTWTDDIALGKGFHREISTGAMTAIKFCKPEEPSWTCKTLQTYEVLSTSSSYSNAATAGGSLSFEGYGANASVSCKRVQSLDVKSDSLVVTALLTYLSEPIRLINPAITQHEVHLTEEAAKVLRKEGPVSFHEKYGTHYVSGYFKGGSMTAAYTTKFKSREACKSDEAEFTVAFGKWGFNAGASGSFSQLLAESSSVDNSYGTTECVGWSGSSAPQPICSLADVEKAYKDFKLDNGQKMEALLSRYSDIEGYRTIMAEFYQQHTHAKRVHHIEEYAFGQLRSELNAEYMRLDFLARRLLDTSSLSEPLKLLEKRVVDALRLFRTTLAPQAGQPVEEAVSEVRKRYWQLQTYLLTYDKTPPADDRRGDLHDFKRGKELYLRLMCAEELEHTFDTLLGPLKPLKRLPVGLAKAMQGLAWASAGLHRAQDRGEDDKAQKHQQRFWEIEFRELPEANARQSEHTRLPLEVLGRLMWLMWDNTWAGGDHNAEKHRNYLLTQGANEISRELVDVAAKMARSYWQSANSLEGDMLSEKIGYTPKRSDKQED